MSLNGKNTALRLLALITTAKKADKAELLFRKESLPLQNRFLAEGTASSEIMDMLGLGSVDKSVLLGVMTKQIADKMLEKLRKELKIGSVNSGIAFTVPITGANAFVLRALEQVKSDSALQEERKGEVILTEGKYVVIAAIVNRGFANNVMECAKPAGARGGTVIHSRQSGSDEITNLWGLGIQDERDIVLILSDSESKLPIMNAIGEKCGIKSDANGIVLSMPIDDVIGFHADR